MPLNGQQNTLKENFQTRIARIVKCKESMSAYLDNLQDTITEILLQDEPIGKEKLARLAEALQQWNEQSVKALRDGTDASLLRLGYNPAADHVSQGNVEVVKLLAEYAPELLIHLAEHQDEGYYSFLQEGDNRLIETLQEKGGRHAEIAEIMLATLEKTYKPAFEALNQDSDDMVAQRSSPSHAANGNRRSGGQPLNGPYSCRNPQ